MDTKLMLATAFVSVLAVEWLLPAQPPADPYSYPAPRPAITTPTEVADRPVRSEVSFPPIRDRRPSFDAAPRSARFE